MIFRDLIFKISGVYSVGTLLTIFRMYVYSITNKTWSERHEEPVT